MNMKQKILFIGFDDFSQINQPVLNQLAIHFSTYRIETVWLKPKLKKRKITLALAFGHMVWELGGDFLFGYKKPANWRNHFYSTGFMMRTLSEMAKEATENNTYAFTFQTQSLFQCPGGVFGNFIYTDHTNLNNLNYQNVNPREYLASASFQILERNIYKRAARVFVMSENVRQSLIQQYGLSEEQTALVYAGANGHAGHSEPDRYRRKNIVFAGKDWVRKGGPLLLEAFEKVLEMHPDATLTIIGCTPNTTLKNCKVLGVLPKHRVIEEFNRATIFCLPTRREPFGMVFIEAMVNRLPVVCTATGATPELISDGKNGFLIPYDSDVLANRLNFLLDNPAIAELFAENGYQKVANQYTWEMVGDKMARTIRENMLRQGADGNTSNPIPAAVKLPVTNAAHAYR